MILLDHKDGEFYMNKIKSIVEKVKNTPIHITYFLFLMTVFVFKSSSEEMNINHKHQVEFNSRYPFDLNIHQRN